MIKNDRVYGVPLVQYKDTKAIIEALSGVGEGAIAYATDTDEFGSYNGTTWTWGQGGAFDLAAAIHAATEDATMVADDEFGRWETITGLLRKVKWSSIISSLGAYFVSHSSATAANDFLVGVGTGAWIKKTLAETATILRTALDSVYAAISHTHSAGDVTSGTMATARLGSGTPSASNYLSGDQTYKTPKATDVLVILTNNATINALSTTYAQFGMTGLNAAGVPNISWPQGGVWKSLTIRLSGIQPASGNLVITFVHNNADSALVVTIPASSVSGNYTDSTHTVTFADNDLLYFKIVNNATSPISIVASISMKEEISVVS